MPELPEVETVRRILEPQLMGRTTLSVTVNHTGVIAYPDAAEFILSLTGQTIMNISRRGKFLTIHMESGDSLTVHLRMTGQLLVTPADFPTEKHTHLIAALSGGCQLRFTDVRRFGRLWYLKANEPDTVTGRDRLGIEPTDEELTGKYLSSHLVKCKKPIKEMLHDQSIVCGVGNIYSDEILYAAMIYPGTKCAALNGAEWETLAETISEIILWGIETNHMTADEYLAGKGKEYRNTPLLRAYGREGKPCLRCGETMKHTVIGGRSSCYCPMCQKETADRET